MIQPELTPITKVNIEVTPTARLRDVLARFTDNGDGDSLRILSGLERAIETKRLRSEGEEGDRLRARLEEINAYLASKDIKQKIDLSPVVTIHEQQNGRERLFLRPRSPKDFSEIEESLANGLQGELGANRFSGFLYVDFSSQSLTQDVRRRRAAVDNFKKNATDSTTWYKIYASKPHLLEQDTQATIRFPTRNN